MKKLFSLQVIFVVSCFIVNAQTARFGFTAGTTFANQKFKMDGETEKGKTITGLTAGILVDVAVGEHFSLQPAITFVQKGTKDEDMGEKVQLRVNSIEVPLNFLYNTRGNAGNFFIGAGPSVAFALSGKLKSDNGVDPPVTTNMKFGNSDDDNLKGLDMGANFLTGYCFSNGLFLSANYNLGLSNLLPGGSNDGTLKSNYFGIKLGFLLKGKGRN